MASAKWAVWRLKIKKAGCFHPAFYDKEQGITR